MQTRWPWTSSRCVASSDITQRVVFTSEHVVLDFWLVHAPAHAKSSHSLASGWYSSCCHAQSLECWVAAQNVPCCCFS